MRREEQWLSWAQELQALAQTGLFYTKEKRRLYFLIMCVMRC